MMFDSIPGLAAVILLAFPAALSAQNDDFADAIEIAPQDFPFNEYYQAGGTAEPGEPAHAGVAAAESIWFRYTAGEEAVLRVREFISSGSSGTRVSVYTGESLATLTLVSETTLTSGSQRFYFQTFANTTYHLAFDSAGADSIWIEALPSGGADDVADADPLTGDLPLSFVGNNALATVAPDDEPLSETIPANATVWWTWTAPFTGVVRLDTRESEFATNLIVYREETDGSLTRAFAYVGAVSFPVTTGTKYFFRVGVRALGPGFIGGHLEMIPSTPPPNDDLANARDLGNAPVVTDGEWMLYSSSEEGVPGDDIPTWSTDTTAHQGTAWWTWTCPKSGHYTFSTAGSDWAPQLGKINLYTESVGNLTLVTTNTATNEARIVCAEGTTYWIQLNAGWFRSSSRTELAIYPSETVSPYFSNLATSYFRIYGPDRHPEADPDADGLPNGLELLFNTDPEKRGPDSSPSHWLEEFDGQLNFVFREPSSSYLIFPGTPLEVVVETAPAADGPWTPQSSINFYRSPYYLERVPLPSGGTAAFCRVRFNDPNLVVPD